MPAAPAPALAAAAAPVAPAPAVVPAMTIPSPPAPALVAAPGAAARAAPPIVADARGDVEHLAEARRALTELVPRSSAQTHARIARVLWLAANAHHPANERAVVEALVSASGSVATGLVPTAASTQARRLHDEAREAFRTRRHVPEALGLEFRAFGADPNDGEIAGFLAFLHLKQMPADAERARQLALHAIGVRGGRPGPGRLDDWMTFAIASALTGREADARHALFTTLALTRDAERSCGVALAAFASFGEPLRAPVEALLRRLHAQGRTDGATSCDWPTGRFAGSRWQ
jgi:hypothetical protein